MILHLLRCQGIAVGDYSFNLGRLEATASSTFATSGFKGAELIGFNKQGKFGDVNDKKGSGLRVPCFAFQDTQGRHGSVVK